MLDATWVSNDKFVTCGLKNYMLWEAPSKKKDMKKARNSMTNKFTACHYDPHEKVVLASTLSGELFVCRGDFKKGKELKPKGSKGYHVTGTKKKKARPIDALYATEKYWFTGGRDRCIVIMGKKGKVQKQINL